jgi:hypothetical protein
MFRKNESPIFRVKEKAKRETTNKQATSFDPKDAKTSPGFYPVTIERIHYLKKYLLCSNLRQLMLNFVSDKRT